MIKCSLTGSLTDNDKFCLPGCNYCNILFSTFFCNGSCQLLIIKSKKKGNDQELIQSDPTSHPQNWLLSINLGTDYQRYPSWIITSSAVCILSHLIGLKRVRTLDSYLVGYLVISMLDDKKSLVNFEIMIIGNLRYLDTK